jgi:hypothetical protein
MPVIQTGDCRHYLKTTQLCDGAFDSDMTRTTPGASSRGGCTGGELSHLFVVSLGNKPGESVRTAAGDTSIQIENQKLFNNIEEALYWSSTRRSDFPLAGWAFATNLGHQWNNRNLSGAHYTLVVRTGDVAAVQSQLPISACLRSDDHVHPRSPAPPHVAVRQLFPLP